MSGHNKRSRIETAIGQCKHVIGDELRFRNEEWPNAVEYAAGQQRHCGQCKRISTSRLFSTGSVSGTRENRLTP